MYTLSEFEEYTPSKFPCASPVLAWSRKNGYHFLSFTARAIAIANGEEFKIVGVLK